MRIMLNFVPITSGGGAQVALDFLAQANRLYTEHEWLLIARSGTPFVRHVASMDRITLIQIVNDSLASRLHFELVKVPQLIRQWKPAVVYTQFGPSLLLAKVPQVTGCAYSNLFYPEIDFWGSLPTSKRIVKWFIDIYRLWSLQIADTVIFETDDLADRAKIQLRRYRGRIECVRPAVSSLITEAHLDAESLHQCSVISNLHFNVLLLTGYHPNKNLEIVVAAAQQLLMGFGINNIRFVFSLPEDGGAWAKLTALASSLGVDNMLLNLGTVSPENVAAVYSRCDCVLLPSKLESFSNNIAEAWATETPLVITDANWSRSLCGEGALYADTTSCADVAAAIAAVARDSSLRERLKENGARELAGYPSAEERFLKYLNLIEEAAASVGETK